MRIATLDELLDIILGAPPIRLNLEIKSLGEVGRPGGTGDLARLAVAIIRSRGLVDRTLVSSFDPVALESARETEPHIETALLVDRDADLDRAIATAAGAGHVALHPHWELLGKGLEAHRAVAAARRWDLRVNVWTVDDEDRMRALLDAGVDGVITNDPATLRRIVDESHLRS